jgi:uncharacterized protein (TIGR02246 family)
MVRLGFAVPIIGLLMLTSGCQQAPAPAPDTRAADEQAIREIEKDWSNAFGTKDVERVVSFYADDATMMAAGEPGVSGKEAIRASTGKLLAMPGLSLSFQTAKVDVARSGDLAYAQGTFAMSMDGPKKGVSVSDKGKYVTVYRKQAGGEWKAVADIFNSDQMAPAPSSK